MRNKVLGILITIFWLTFLFIGCSENNNGTNQDDSPKFIGIWLEEGEAPNNLTWIFYENNSIKFIYYPGGNTGNSIIYWGIFELNSTILDVESNNIIPVNDRFNYQFSNNDTRLILTSIYGGDQTMLNKVK